MNRDSVIASIQRIEGCPKLEDIKSFLTPEDIRTNNNYVLRAACDVGNLDILKYLKEELGFTVDDARSKDGWAMRVACLKGHLPIVKYLCEDFGLELKDVRTMNDWALQRACVYKRLEVVNYLRDRFGFTMDDIKKAIDDYGCTEEKHTELFAEFGLE